MKKFNTVSIIVCVVCLIAAYLCFSALSFGNDETKIIRVGFVYDGDESTPYTYNFMRAQKAVAAQYGERVQISVKSNTSEEDGEAAIVWDEVEA